jgi:hypothetical protein
MNRIYALLSALGYPKHGILIFRFLHGERFLSITSGLFHHGPMNGSEEVTLHGLTILFDQNFSQLDLYRLL